jgi:hypothetical protein
MYPKMQSAPQNSTKRTPRVTTTGSIACATAAVFVPTYLSSWPCSQLQKVLKNIPTPYGLLLLAGGGFGSKRFWKSPWFGLGAGFDPT